MNKDSLKFKNLTVRLDLVATTSSQSEERSWGPRFESQIPQILNAPAS